MAYRNMKKILEEYEAIPAKRYFRSDEMLQLMDILAEERRNSHEFDGEFGAIWLGLRAGYAVGYKHGRNDAARRKKSKGSDKDGRKKETA